MPDVIGIVMPDVIGHLVVRAGEIAGQAGNDKGRGRQ